MCAVFIEPTPGWTTHGCRWSGRSGGHILRHKVWLRQTDFHSGYREDIWRSGTTKTWAASNRTNFQKLCTASIGWRQRWRRRSPISQDMQASKISEGSRLGEAWNCERHHHSKQNCYSSGKGAFYDILGCA